MQTIAEIFSNARANNTTPVSFEIFPPKGELALEDARTVASELARLAPDFISVTYSAGGSGNSQATAQVAELIQKEFNIPVCAHLTCAHATTDTLHDALADLKARGITNVLALRGDLPKGVEPQEFHYAKDLIPLLKEEGFCVGAAAYPEGHLTCEHSWENLEHLKQKQDAGADFFVTQLFFDNTVAYRFLDDARTAGITAPISCGIMPFLGKSQIQRMVFMCGASLPSPLIKLLYKYEDDPQGLRRAGIEYANEQLEGLVNFGVDGLHLYTMNHPDIAQANVHALRRAFATPRHAVR